MLFPKTEKYRISLITGSICSLSASYNSFLYSTLGVRRYLTQKWRHPSKPTFSLEFTIIIFPSHCHAAFTQSLHSYNCFYKFQSTLQNRMLSSDLNAPWPMTLGSPQDGGASASL